MELFDLKIQGFHPSEFTRTYLNEKMASLRCEAPFGSHLRATFTRHDRIIKGVVTISSSAGQFFAVASGTQLKDVTQKMLERIRKQLERWKSQRLKHESIKNLPIIETTNKEGDCGSFGLA